MLSSSNSTMPDPYEMKQFASEFMPFILEAKEAQPHLDLFINLESLIVIEGMEHLFRSLLKSREEVSETTLRPLLIFLSQRWFNLYSTSFDLVDSAANKLCTQLAQEIGD